MNQEELLNHLNVLKDYLKKISEETEEIKEKEIEEIEEKEIEEIKEEARDKLAKYLDSKVNDLSFKTKNFMCKQINYKTSFNNVVLILLALKEMFTTLVSLNYKGDISEIENYLFNIIDIVTIQNMSKINHEEFLKECHI